MKYKSRFYACTICLFLLTASITIAQEKIRTIEHDKFRHENEPIEVVSRELGDKPFIDDKRVLGNQDWLQHLKLGIKNVSDKNIISFDFDLVVKKDGKVLMGIPIYFRALMKASEDDDENMKEVKKQKALRPGELVKVTVAKRDLSLFGEELKKNGIEDVERVTIDIRFVYFDDGTRWVMGQKALMALRTNSERACTVRFYKNPGCIVA